jgi:hypothetical protein
MDECPIGPGGLDWRRALAVADAPPDRRRLDAVDEGVFGTATVRLSGSNSGTTYVPFEALRHGDLVAVLPVLYLEAVGLEADETTDLVVTVVGRP